MSIDFRSNTSAVRGIRNNNPGNLRPGDNWQGMAGVSDNFIVFKNIEYGIRALATDVSNKFFSGLNTVRKIIDKYAPPSENNTAAYIAAVSQGVGINADTTISLDHPTLKKLVKAIALHELGETGFDMIPDSEWDAGISMMNPQIVQRIKGF
jgi:hypothetical protein